MSGSPELSTTPNIHFEVIRSERKARKIAKAALDIDFTLRQEWLSRSFPATFGARRNDTNYYGFKAPSPLWAINQDSARPYLTLWTAETMARAMTHLSSKSLEQVGAARAFDGEDFGGGDSPMYVNLSKSDQRGQIALVAPSDGPDWLRPRPIGSTLSPVEYDFYGVISRLPNLLDSDETRSLIQERSDRRNPNPMWPVDFSANGLGGAIVEMDDLVLQVTSIDPSAFRTFDVPGVAKGFDKDDKTKTFPIMKDAHLIRAWRTKDVE